MPKDPKHTGSWDAIGVPENTWKLVEPGVLKLTDTSLHIRIANNPKCFVLSYDNEHLGSYKSLTKAKLRGLRLYQDLLEMGVVLE